MEMAEENVPADGPVAEFLFEFVPKQTDSRATVENQNMVRIGPDFDA
jgi:hypothetical protein